MSEQIEKSLSETASLPRSQPEITMFRGDHFADKFDSIYESQKCQKLIENFRSEFWPLKRQSDL